MKARRIVYNAETGETRVEEFDYTPLHPPPRPKLYRIYKEITTSKGKKIKSALSEVMELDSDEINELQGEGYKVEEIT